MWLLSHDTMMADVAVSPLCNSDLICSICSCLWIISCTEKTQQRFTCDPQQASDSVRLHSDVFLRSFYYFSDLWTLLVLSCNQLYLLCLLTLLFLKAVNSRQGVDGFRLDSSLQTNQKPESLFVLLFLCRGCMKICRFVCIHRLSSKAAASCRAVQTCE